MLDANAPEALIGGDILNLITVGMYDNPLAIYREYIQNAADAISNAESLRDGKVEINIDPSGLSVRIRDNGPGLSHEAALRALLPIARSQKQRGTDSGFRGIGRLSGLAFAESVTFKTRAQANQPITRIIWDGPKLRNAIAKSRNTESAIRECITLEILSEEEYPDHFFEVEVGGVGRHAAGLILNREAVQAYIGEVCPVPIGPSFPFFSETESLYGKDKATLELEVTLNGELTPVTRRYGEIIRFSKDREDRFVEFEEIDIPSTDGNNMAAIGWVAHSSYLGAIPKETGIRGIRARAGNIQIGDENVFEHLFPEERFNRWCVGEIHIVDSRIVPNGRRDYFEPGPHTRNLENQMAAVARRISARCRTASTARNKEYKFQTELAQMEETYDLAVSGYLSPENAKALIGQALSRIQGIRESLDTMNSQVRENLEKLYALERKLSSFRVRRGRPPLGSVAASEVATYRKIFQTLAEASPSPRAAKEMIEAVLANA